MDKDRVRLQIDMTAERLTHLDQIKEIAGLGSRKEVINNAFCIFQWAIMQAVEGREIASVAEDGSYRQLAMPALDNARGSK